MNKDERIVMLKLDIIFKRVFGLVQEKQAYGGLAESDQCGNGG